jgi:Chalcone isomerase-like
MLKQLRHATLMAALSASAIAAGPALGAQCLDVQFPDSVKVGGTDLVLNGMGIRKATMLAVKVYVAGLYLPQKSSDGNTILAANTAWELDLHFVHSADASDMRDAYDDGFEKAAGDNLDALKPKIEALKSQITDMEEGQELSYAYDPSAGTVVTVNGKAGAPIEGADFAAALLKINIGPEPPNEDLKTGLLGGACE